MQDIPKKDDLPLFILYDEFGHANIPNFDAIVTNIRKYKVSLSLVLQSFSQLYTQYDKQKAETIIEGGVSSKLFYTGLNLETAKMIEHILGRVIREETYAMSKNDDTRTSRQEYNLLNADEIRTLPENKAFFITGNKRPALLDVTAYFQNRKMKGKVKLGEAFIQGNNFQKYELKNILDDV
jgi:type IV secretory pathway TraG/TraD family ATPase VirD4